MRVVFASAELSPFAKTGGLGDVCGSLPKALATHGHDVVIFTPWYSDTGRWFDRNPDFSRPEAVVETTLAWGGWSAPLTIARSHLPGTGIAVFFVVNDAFFARETLYSFRSDGLDDNLERYTFFCRAVIRGCELLGIQPEILHAHDWHAGLLPLYLHSGLRSVSNFSGTGSVYTIHNLSYQGAYGPDRFAHLGLHHRYWSADALEHYGVLNVMKGAILFSDQVTTVSPTYAREITTPEGGAGLDGILREVEGKVTGILNGIDVEEWNPATDRHLDARFERGKLLGKKICKRMLSREAGLRFDERVPLFGFVSRLVNQKGVDLLLAAIPQIIAAGANVVVLGSGEGHYEESLRYYSEVFTGRMKAWIGFDNRLAHRIFGAIDVLLMPSLYEPCGLNQMYALHYGALPLVRLTGGLADTVIPWNGANREVANGLGFLAPDPSDLVATAHEAIRVWKNTRLRKRLQENGMTSDFSWERSARDYESVYERARR
ncbi:MAG TPA: glycogen/starch synthase [Thermoanaerobaculia bacterium]|nr:glycogen/starch synthase [Thermoanaerobaculia bacterium]